MPWTSRAHALLEIGRIHVDSSQLENPVKKRTRARELALQFLYQVDVLKAGVIDELDAFLRQEERDAETCRFAKRK